MSGKAIAASPADRFDESFLIRTIRDFFLALIVVILLELGFRFVLVIYDYYFEQKRETELVAERLASSVKSIMLNSGGPVAARTVYPILDQNLTDLGFMVAIVPSKMTVSSIEAIYDFTPQGIAPDWSEGPHHEATVQLQAEEFCRECHIEATVGDVLGHVTVRKTLSGHLENWWHEVQVAGTVGIVNILLHTIVLYLLLKARMTPLLALRDAVGHLAKAGSDLSVRAEVLSRDKLRQTVASWREVVSQTRGSGISREAVTGSLIELGHDLSEVSHLISDMAVLEERMTAVAQEGQTLLGRLRPSAGSDEPG